MDLFVIGVAELRSPRRFVCLRAVAGTWDHERKVFYNLRYYGETRVYSIIGLRAGKGLWTSGNHGFGEDYGTSKNRWNGGGGSSKC